MNSLDKDRISLVKAIDHTILSPVATSRDIAKLCEEAAEYGFAAVCINPWHVRQAVGLLSKTDVKVAVVAGFPLGAMTTSAKVFEAGEAAEAGAHEIDLVINIAALKEGMSRYVAEEIARVQRCVPYLKVILETALLSDDEKRQAALLAREAGAQMVKTSTGFQGGATVADVLLLRETVPDLGIKASGGIRDAAFALELLTAGATRLGTSSALKILAELDGPSV